MLLLQLFIYFPNMTAIHFTTIDRDIKYLDKMDGADTILLYNIYTYFNTSLLFEYLTFN